jgi:hypothetical protein
MYMHHIQNVLYDFPTFTASELQNYIVILLVNYYYYYYYVEVSTGLTNSLINV